MKHRPLVSNSKTSSAFPATAAMLYAEQGHLLTFQRGSFTCAQYKLFTIENTPDIKNLENHLGQPRFRQMRTLSTFAFLSCQLETRSCWCCQSRSFAILLLFEKDQDWRIAFDKHLTSETWECWLEQHVQRVLIHQHHAIFDFLKSERDSCGYDTGTSSLLRRPPLWRQRRGVLSRQFWLISVQTRLTSPLNSANSYRRYVLACRKHATCYR
jgi:hypothetical protein